MPHLGDGAVHLMRAESPGPIKSKLVPKVGQTAKILYGIYIGLTLLESVALRIAGMSWYDAVNHAFTTMATGGFSVRNASIAAYNSPLITWIITVFMFLAGTNFSLLFLVLRGRLREVLRSEELRIYTIIIVCATVFICLDLSAHSHLSFSQTFTDSAFQVVTIITTTGYATKDFALWPTTSQVVLTALMFTGACAGSTAGGIKISRITLLAKSLHREMNRLIHPNHISVIKSEGRPVDERVVSSASVFFVSFILVWARWNARCQLGQPRLYGVVHRAADVHQQRRPRSRHARPGGELLHSLPRQQARLVAADADGASGADAHSRSSASLRLEGTLKTAIRSVAAATDRMCILCYTMHKG